MQCSPLAVSSALWEPLTMLCMANACDGRGTQITKGTIPLWMFHVVDQAPQVPQVTTYRFKIARGPGSTGPRTKCPRPPCCSSLNN